MVEKLSDLLPVILTAFFLWLVGLTVIFYRLLSHYQRLTKGVRGENLTRLLDAVISQEDKNKKDIIALVDEIKRIDNELVFPIQRVGFTKFNAFGTASDGQSFVLALLDKKDDGVVLTCLHARDRTRVYAKAIKGGKSSIELSGDEIKALKVAHKQ